MISADYASVIERDEAIPGLATLLDTEAFCGALRNLEGCASIESADLLYLRYKPQQNCLALYDLHLKGGTVAAYAKAYGADASIKLEKAELRPRARGAGTLARAALSGARIEVAAFPNDAKLRCLQRLGDAASRRRMLARVLPDRPALWDAVITPLAYKPERRFVAMVSAGADKAVLKFYTRNGYERARPGARVHVAGNSFRTAPLIGRSKTKHVLAFEHCRGHRLRELVGAGGAGPWLRGLGAALAGLHASAPHATLPRASIAGERQRLRAIIAQLRWIVPEEEQRVLRAAVRLDEWLRTELSVSSLVHGDFYDKQVLIDGRDIVLLDFDLACVGDHRSDLGNFIAHLLAAGNPEVATLALELVGGYRDGMSSRQRTVASLASLSQATALALMYIAHAPFRRAEHDWKVRIAQILDQVEALLGSRYEWLEPP